MGAHPSFIQGYDDRDNPFDRDWSAISPDPDRLQRWRDEWVRGTKNHAQYVERLGAERVASLAVGPALSQPVDYGQRITA